MNPQEIYNLGLQAGRTGNAQAQAAARGFSMPPSGHILYSTKPYLEYVEKQRDNKTEK